MKKIKLFLELTFLIFLSSILISFGKIKNNSTKRTDTAVVFDAYAAKGKDSKSIFFATKIKDFLGKSIKEVHDTYLEINLDTNQDQKADIVIQAISKKGRIYFYEFYDEEDQNKSFENQNKALLGSVIITPLNSEPITFIKDKIYLYAGIKKMEIPSFFDFIGEIFNASNCPNVEEVMTLVIEIPNKINVNTAAINTWVSVKKK